MIILTLCAILIYQMKMANHLIQDGTLIGSSFFLCFTYWIGSSIFFSSASLVFNSKLTLFNYLDLIVSIRLKFNINYTQTLVPEITGFGFG